MKTVFVGAVEGSLAALDAICRAGHRPSLIVTLPLDLATRHSDFADLRAVARAYSIPVHETARSDSADTLARIAAVVPDVILVIGWSQICGPAFRALPRLGCIGFHPSALPKLRGRGVIPWTILQSEKTSGASLFWLADGADTGDIAAQRTFDIDPEKETARSLYDKQIVALSEMLPSLLENLKQGQIPRRPQDASLASLCAQRLPEDGRIDWREPAAVIHRLIRAVGPPYPGAFTHDANNRRILILRSALTPEVGYYIGLAGQVQAVSQDRFTVMCGDGRCVDILDWSERANAPKLHSRLG
jgi:methionyl-tRNA formyltransferase